MLSPTILAQLNQQHLADLRRECEAERLAHLALEARLHRSMLSALHWPKLTWLPLFGLRRRHVAL